MTWRSPLIANHRDVIRRGMCLLIGMSLVLGSVALLRPRTASDAVSAGILPAPGARPDAPFSVNTLAEIATNLERCAQSSTRDCSGVIYVGSAAMPLSLQGLVEVGTAVRELSLSLSILDAGALYEITDGNQPGRAIQDPLAGGDARVSSPERAARYMVARGATLHHPAVLVHRNGRILGNAILGYKSGSAYRALIAGRLTGDAREQETQDSGSMRVSQRSAGLQTEEDITVRGSPGPYFRYVPNHHAIAYASADTVFLLDLTRRLPMPGPGFIDFVPSPDGRLFVTPSEHGLEFYDAAEVLEAAYEGRGREVRPIHRDRDMRDQYPSVGVLGVVLSRGGSRRTTYRVLTSWFDKVAFRDYEVSVAAPGARRVVRAAGRRVAGCPGRQVSIPIMSPSGSELAGRDETTGTTKIFRLNDDGTCIELLDLGLPTGKIAWHPDGRRIAFAIPNGAAAHRTRPQSLTADSLEALAGIFVFHRRDASLHRVPRSETVNRLAFPEFIGSDSIMFLLPEQRTRNQGRFRLVCCLH